MTNVTPIPEHSVDAVRLNEQATQLEDVLPRILRRLFTLQPDHPVAEMPVAQLRTCSVLRSGPRSMSILSEEMGISVSAMTQIADRMERTGLVERVIGQEDRRQKMLQLTPYGNEIMQARHELRVSRAEAALQTLQPEEREATLQMLHSLLAAVYATAPLVPNEENVTIRQEQG